MKKLWIKEIDEEEEGGGAGGGIIMSYKVNFRKM
jgi:hypothetical protein